MIYEFGPCQIDSERQELRLSGELASVQPQVFSLILYLIEHRRRVVSKDEIIEAVWQGRSISDGALNARINAVRQALGDTGERQAIIKTIPRRGFRFVAEVEPTSSTTINAASGDQRIAGAIVNQDKPSVVVLPFVNLGRDENEEYVADGLTEDLVTALSKLRGFFVPGRSTTFSFKGGVHDARAVAQEIDVRYVLQGSVRSAGKRVRITAQLVEAESGNQIWGENYDRDLTDIFAVQDEVVESLVGCLAPELYAAEHARLRRRPPQSLDAWEYFIHALHHYSQQSKDSSAEAIQLLEKAIELDPDYAQALGLYAITLSWRVIQRWEPWEESIAKAKDAADRAVLADSNDPWASLGRGMVFMVSRDSNSAIMNFGRAVDLSPNFAYAHAMLGAVNAYAGNADIAVAHIDTALRLSPRDTFIDKFHLYYSLAHFQAGRYLEAAKAADRAIHIRPEHANTHMIAASSYALAGEQIRAAEALTAFKKLVPNTDIENVERAIAFNLSEDRQRLVNGLRMAGLQ